MKKLLILLPILCLSLSVLAQKNNVKGRLLLFPTSTFAYALGLGYESQFNARLSAQLSMNFYGFDMQNTDGGATFVVSIIPEARWWLKSIDLETKQNSIFIAAFLEFAKSKMTPGGEGNFGQNYLLAEENGEINPGLLLGYKKWIAKKWFLEFYTGPKYRFIKEDKEFRRQGRSVTEIAYKNQLGFRIGINAGVLLK